MEERLWNYIGYIPRFLFQSRKESGLNQPITIIIWGPRSLFKGELPSFARVGVQHLQLVSSTGSMDDPVAGREVPVARDIPVLFEVASKFDLATLVEFLGNQLNVEVLAWVTTSVSFASSFVVDVSLLPDGRLKTKSGIRSYTCTDLTRTQLLELLGCFYFD